MEENRNSLLYFIKWLMQPGVFGRIDIFVRNDHTGFDEEKDDVILTVLVTNGRFTLRYSFNSNLVCVNKTIDYELLKNEYIKGRRVTDRKKNLVKELALIINMIKLQRMYNDNNNSVMFARYSKSVMQSFAFALKLADSDNKYIKFFYKDMVHEYPFIIIGERPTNGRGQHERLITHNTFLEQSSSASIFSVEEYFTFLCERLEEAVEGFVA